MSEGTLLGLQSSVGVALTHSLELHRKEEALVRPPASAISNLPGCACKCK